jgi:hypothetical protein
MPRGGLTITRVDLRRMQQIARDLPDALDDALNATAHEALAEIVLSFGSGPAGRTYTHEGVSHVASSPGHPPNVDTGALRASMRAEKTGSLEYQVMDGVEYGVYLELGTERMAARPFVTPVIEQMRQGEFGRMMRRYLEDTGVW